METYNLMKIFILPQLSYNLNMIQYKYQEEFFGGLLDELILKAIWKNKSRKEYSENRQEDKKIQET